MKNIIFKVGVLIILLLPILNYPPLFSPPDFGKAIIFRIVCSVLLFVFAYYCFFHKETDLFKKTVNIVKSGGLLFYTPIVLLGVLVIATLFSSDTHFSIFGDPNRGGGFLTFAMIVLFSYVLLFSLNKKQWRSVWKVSFLAGAVVSFLAIIQWLDVFEWMKTSTRPFSTMGNATLLSIYLLLLFFPLLSFLITEKKKIFKLLYSSLLLLFSFVILITFTRAVFIGLFIGMVYLLLFYPRRGKAVLAIKIATVAVIFLSFFTLYYVNTYENPRIVEESEILSRLTSRLSIERALGDPRVGGFLIGWEAVKEKPLLGYGPENFATAFSQHYHPEMPNIEKDIPWWDKAHNLFIEMAVWGGVPAATLLLLFFILLFLALQKNKNREKHTLQAGVIAFFAASMFTIDSFSVFLIFFLLFAYTVFLSLNKEEQSVNLEKRKIFLRYKTLFIAASLLFLSIFIYSYSILPLLANKDINKAIAYRNAEGCEKALELADRATKYDTIIDSYLYRAKAGVVERCTEQNAENALLVYQICKKAEEERPLHIQNLVDKVGYIIKVLPYMEEENREMMIKDAEETLAFLKEVTPHRYNIYMDEAKMDLIVLNYQGVYEGANKCVQLKDEGECYFMLAFSKIALEKDGVKEDLAKAKELGVDLKTENKINILIMAYAEAEEYEEIITLFHKLIETDPQNAQYHLSLAVNYKEVGKYTKAREHALIAIQLRPAEAERIYQFINSMPQ